MIIGLDIGGTKISGIAWSGKGVVSELKLLTPRNLGEFKLALRSIVLYLTQGKTNINVGVAVAGVVDREKGVARHSPNLTMINGFNFKRFFNSMGFKNIRVENDANCFALAESALGQGKRFQSFVGLTLGTGLGGGLILQRKLLIGEHGSAGEPGHMLAGEKLTYEKRFQALKRKNDWQGMGKLFGRLTADMYNLLDVEAIILGGSIARKFGKKIAPTAKKEASRRLLNKAIKPKVLVSKLKHAGALGAALLF